MGYGKWNDIHTYPRTFGTGSSVSFKNIALTIKDMIKLYFKVKILDENNLN